MIWPKNGLAHFLDILYSTYILFLVFVYFLGSEILFVGVLRDISDIIFRVRFCCLYALFRSDIDSNKEKILRYKGFLVEQGITILDPIPVNTAYSADKNG